MKKKNISERLAALACAALMSVPLWGDMSEAISFGTYASAESEAVYEEIESMLVSRDASTRRSAARGLCP